MEIGKVCRDTTTIPHNSSTKRGYMRGGGVAYIYIYTDFLIYLRKPILIVKSLQWRQRKQGGAVGADEARARRFDDPFPVPGLLRTLVKSLGLPVARKTYLFRVPYYGFYI